jgi:hypothetical protein
MLRHGDTNLVSAPPPRVRLRLPGPSAFPALGPPPRVRPQQVRRASAPPRRLRALAFLCTDQAQGGTTQGRHPLRLATRGARAEQKAAGAWLLARLMRQACCAEHSWSEQRTRRPVKCTRQHAATLPCAPVCTRHSQPKRHRQRDPHGLEQNIKLLGRKRQLHAVIRLKLVPRAAARTGCRRGCRRVLRPCPANLQVPARLAPFGPRVACRVQRAEELLASGALRRWCARLREYRRLHAPARHFSCMQYAPGIAVHACSRPRAHAHTKHTRKRALPFSPRHAKTHTSTHTHTHTHTYTHTGYLPAALPRSCSGCWPCRFADAALRGAGLPRLLQSRAPLASNSSARCTAPLASNSSAKGRAGRGRPPSGTRTAAHGYTHPHTPTHMRPH